MGTVLRRQVQVGGGTGARVSLLGFDLSTSTEQLRGLADLTFFLGLHFLTEYGKHGSA